MFCFLSFRISMFQVYKRRNLLKITFLVQNVAKLYFLCDKDVLIDVLLKNIQYNLGSDYKV